MLRLSTLACLLLLLCGCGEKTDGLIPVSGTIKFADGTVPIGESALIWFEATESGNKSASGTIEADGSFELMTFKPGDGVGPGKYKVVAKVYKSYREQTLAVPQQYADASATPLEAIVDADNTHFDFVIER
jgi:hypothetical protein